MKLCQDCRWVILASNSEGICAHTTMSIMVTNFVTGESETKHPSCQLVRTLGKCGHEGLLWEEKDGEPPCY
jgi:hypothetical protein